MDSPGPEGLGSVGDGVQWVTACFAILVYVHTTDRTIAGAQGQP